MSDWRRVLRLLDLVLSRDDDGQPVDDSHHDPLVSTASSFNRIPSTALLVGYRASKDGAPIEVPRVPLVLLGSGRWRVTLGPLEQSHDVGLDRVRLADRRRQLRLVLVRLRVRMVALHGHRVPHPRRYNVREALHCVSGVDFVAGHARNLIHSEHTHTATTRLKRTMVNKA